MTTSPIHRTIARLAAAWLGFDVPRERLESVIGPALDTWAIEAGTSADDLLARIGVAGPTSEQGKRFVELVTVGETFFYRHGDQLEAIARSMAAMVARTGRPVRAWCAACSTGEEAYTLAALLERDGTPGTVHATDINQSSLAFARIGRGYRDRVVSQVPAALRPVLLERDGSFWAVRRAIRDRVTFGVHNLVTSPPPTERADVIVCRNVLIYFPPDVAERAIRNLLTALHTDGWLWLGVTDALNRTGDQIATDRRLAVGPGDFDRRTASERRVTVPAADAASTAVHRVCSLVERGYAGLAEHELERLEAGDIADPRWPTALGNLALRQHDYAAADRHYQRALLKRPRNHEVLYLLGVSAHKQGRTDQARSWLSRASEAQPRFWPAWVLAAMLARRAADPVALRRCVEAGEAALRHAGSTRFGETMVWVASVHTDPEEATEFLRNVRGELDAAA